MRKILLMAVLSAFVSIMAFGQTAVYFVNMYETYTSHTIICTSISSKTEVPFDIAAKATLSVWMVSDNQLGKWIITCDGKNPGDATRDGKPLGINIVKGNVYVVDVSNGYVYPSKTKFQSDKPAIIYDYQYLGPSWAGWEIRDKNSKVVATKKFTTEKNGLDVLYLQNPGDYTVFAWPEAGEKKRSILDSFDEPVTYTLNKDSSYSLVINRDLFFELK